MNAVAGDLRLLIRDARMPWLPAGEQADLDRYLRGRWISYFQDDMRATGVPALAAEIRSKLVTGTRLQQKPARGPDSVIKGVPTVSYRYSDGTTVHVPRTGPPRPMRIDLADGMLTYADFGVDIVVDLPEPDEAIWFGDIPDDLYYR